MPQNTPAHSEFAEDVAQPVSLAHLVRTVRAYSTVIMTTFAAVLLAYALVAVAITLWSPSERVTSQPFRLDFEGAATGLFPNGLRFSTTDVVSPTILLQVYKQNELARYLSFPDFSRSVFVLESNRAYELLVAEYQARLADPKLSPVDRERIQKEYEQKRDAIAKNEYSLNFVMLQRLRKVPEPIVRKVLADILNSWARYAVKDQDVLAYRIAVLSPQVLAPSELEKGDPMMAVQLLRSRTVRLLNNLAALQELPGAELARGGPDRVSLEEVRMRMEEIQRYEIEPLVSRIRASGMETSLTLRFIQDQIEYDERQLDAARRRADALKQTLVIYAQSVTPPTTAAAQSATSTGYRPSEPQGGETVMPQLSDTFLDRMAALVSKSEDARYRQQVVDDYRKAMEAVIPLEQTVAYQTKLVESVKSGATPRPRVDPVTIQRDIDTARNELKILVARMNDIYREISRNVYSTSQLITITAPPSNRVNRSVDVRKLLLGGLAVALMSLPLIIIGCLLHNRVREEETQDDIVPATQG